MQKKLDGLNLFRIGLMLWVLSFHAKLRYEFEVNQFELNRLILIGAVAVTGFFVMSGFVLRYQYADRLSTGGQVKKYLVNRISGIYPIYFVMLVIAVLAHYKCPDLSTVGGWRVLLCNLLLLQSFDIAKHQPFFFNDNVWYLCVAFVLYLVFPVLNWVLNEFAGRISKPKRIVLFLAVAVFSEYLYAVNIHPPIQNDFMKYYTDPLLRIPEFFAGMLLCDLYRSSDLAGAEKPKRSYGLLFLACAATAAGSLGIFPLIRLNYNLYEIVLIPCFGGIILALCSFSESSFLVRFARLKIVSVCADLAFMCYLCQSFSLWLVDTLRARGAFASMHRVQFCFFVSTIGFAVAAHWLVEIPGKYLCRKGLHFLFSNKGESAE